MDAWIARKIERQRLGRHIAQPPALLDLRIEAEALRVAGEYQQAAGRKPLHALSDQLDMIALDVEHALHALGV